MEGRLVDVGLHMGHVLLQPRLRLLCKVRVLLIALPRRPEIHDEELQINSTCMCIFAFVYGACHQEYARLLRAYMDIVSAYAQYAEDLHLLWQGCTAFWHCTMPIQDGSEEIARQLPRQPI